MTSDSNRSDSENKLNRRRVLKATGAAGFSGAALSGVASAHRVTEGPVFCGCSQVCACGVGQATVIVATENNDGSFSCRSVVQNFNFCYSVNEGKIIAVRVDGTTYCNPNEACAGDALADCGITCDLVGEQGGPCGKPPCEHPGRGNGPDNGNGPGVGGGPPDGNGH